jgi:hypothetical protein
VVACDSLDQTELQRIDTACREAQPPVPFIAAAAPGLFAFMFSDFGPRFTVVDVNGEAPADLVVISVTEVWPPCDELLWG